MKMIDVLNMMAKGEIKEGTKLVIGGNVYSYIDTYTDDSGCSFVNEEGYSDTFLEDEEMITQHFLNLEVEMIPPKLKKYYLRLHGGTSNFEDYVNRHKENFGLHSYIIDSYIIDDNEECNGFYTKFTQAEIDNDKFLKFVEQHGIKEEVAENEID